MKRTLWEGASFQLNEDTRACLCQREEFHTISSGTLWKLLEASETQLSTITVPLETTILKKPNDKGYRQVKYGMLSSMLIPYTFSADFLLYGTAFQHLIAITNLPYPQSNFQNSLPTTLSNVFTPSRSRSNSDPQISNDR